MKHRFFLTSLIVAGLMRPAMSETFPADGYMLEDKTYENAATYTNTGVYDGSVTATAEYTDNVYNIAAGMYLPQNSEAAAPCTAGYFCTGMTDAMYSESGDQGLTKCPTEYPKSVAGAGAQTQCYTACTVATANIAHATGVSGNDYYGDGADTCTPTSCDNGYHPESGEIKIVKKTPIIPVDYTLPGDGYAYVDASGVHRNNNLADASLTDPNTWALHFDYGTVYGRASCQPNGKPVVEYYFTNMDAVMAGTMTFEEFESGLATFVGTAKAAALMNALADGLDAEASGDEAAFEAAIEKYMEIMYFVLTADPDADYGTDSEGQHCYCQTTGYTPTGGSFVEATSASWVYLLDPLESAAYCASNCAYICAGILQYDEASSRGVRAAMFDSLEAIETGGSCAANDIKINWSDAEEIGDAGMCKYGGDIKTPVKAVAKKGKTFKGWKFEKAN